MNCKTCIELERKRLFALRELDLAPKHLRRFRLREFKEVSREVLAYMNQHQLRLFPDTPVSNTGVTEGLHETK